MDILRLFYDCDEFCREFLPRLRDLSNRRGGEAPSPTPHTECERSDDDSDPLPDLRFSDSQDVLPPLYLPASSPVLSPARELFALCRVRSRSPVAPRSLSLHPLRALHRPLFH